MRRPMQLGLTLAAVVLAAGAGWLGGSRVKSPAQIAAEAEPPPPSRITVPVELRTLTSEIVVRGDVGFDEPLMVTLSDPPGMADSEPIVTLVPEKGTEIVEGDRIIEVSGRPVLVLQGELPMFRTLRHGDVGDDVLQLEEALARLGFEIASPDDIYDTETATALTAWYRSLGYNPIGPTDQELAELDGAEQAVADAKDWVRDAETSLAQARQPLSESERLSLDAEVRRAEHNLEEQKRLAEEANAAAAQAVTDAQTALTEAETASTVAQDRLAQAEAGTHPDTGLPPTDDELAQLRQDAADAAAAVVVAQDELAVAQAAEAEAERQGEWAISEAEHDLAFAVASRDERLAGPDTTAERRMVSDARERLAEAKADLAEIQARVGVGADRSEILFIGSLPVRVERVLVDRGDLVSGDVMQVTGHSLGIVSDLDVTEAEWVKVGDLVRIDHRFEELDTTGVIAGKADRPGTYGLELDRVHIEIVADEDLSRFSGDNVKITIPIETTGGDVLTVPIAALSAASDGSARVEIENSDGTTEMCAVVVGLTSGGYAEVTPVDGEIDVEDRVVVGHEYETAS